MLLTDPVSTLHRIGAATTSKLRRLGILTIEDLIWHLPQRYEDLRTIKPIAGLTIDEVSTIRGRIRSITVRRAHRRRMFITEMALADETGTARAIWFHQPYIKQMFRIGDELYISGKTQPTLLGANFINPVFEKIKDEQLHTAHIVPFYSLTEGITHKQLRFLIQTAFKSVETIDDTLPKEIIRSERLLPLAEALEQVHFPKDEHIVKKSIQRLKFEELFWMQLSVGYARKELAKKTAPQMQFHQKEITNLVQHLPFMLTADQKKAAWQILKDIERTIPMNRLVQGDVGSGKTVVACIALYNAAINAYQSALMAPTEVLAVQHFHEIRKLLPGVHVALLTSQNAVIDGKKSSRKKILSALADHTIEIIVGTHSLIQEAVLPKRLGLVVIDEQHRFGVAQRKRITDLGQSSQMPHLLSLSATPIPRSLALTLYGDLDISTIHQMPVGRKPILTRIIDEKKRTDAYAFIRKQANLSRQTFILCPLINQGDSLESKSVLSEYERLKKDIFPDLDIRYLHGKLASDEKKKILEDFKKNTFPVLVTTSVIEVGIDIPHATIMIIEGAERFGLAQLHQFRGRVGRNDIQSYCLLFTSAHNPETLKRLRLVCKHQDGFLLAEEDLRMRGEGELFGTKQSGIVNFKVATLRDIDLIKKSRVWVDATIEKDNDLKFYNSVKHRLTDVMLHSE